MGENENKNYDTLMAFSKSRTAPFLLHYTSEPDEMLYIKNWGSMCQVCMSVVYEEIRQWYLKQ